MKADSTSKSKSKKKIVSDQSVSPKVLAESDEDLRHQMLLTSAYYRAERRGFAAPELRDKVIRGEAARRKRESGRGHGLSLIEAESEVDQMLKGTSEVEQYLRSFEQQLALWDGQFKSFIDGLHEIRIDLEAEYDRQLLSIAAHRKAISGHLRELRGFTGEVWTDMASMIDKVWAEMYQATEKIAGSFSLKPLRETQKQATEKAASKERPTGTDEKNAR